jgi:hypothetical protein
MMNANYYNNNNNYCNKNKTSYFVNKLLLRHKTCCNNTYSRLRILPVAELQVNLALNVVVQLVPKLLMFNHLIYNINLLLRLVRVHNNLYNNSNLLLYSNNPILSTKNLWLSVGNTVKRKILYFLFKLTSMPHAWMIVLLLSSSLCNCVETQWHGGDHSVPQMVDYWMSSTTNHLKIC